MNHDRRQKLLNLGADRLADALLELASSIEAADDLVERMTQTPQGNIERYTAKLADIRQSRRFVSWRESSDYARELLAVLDDLRAGDPDPQTGAEMIAAFYECDAGALGCCDDSGGSVGDVFRSEARELFVSYAVRCANKKWLGNLVLRLMESDSYGVRDVLVDCAAEYLPEEVMREMVSRMLELADQEPGEYQRRNWLRGVESLARQFKDPALFERARLASWGTLSTAACVDIARVYLECGNELAALTWLEKIPEADTYMQAERDNLLLEIHGRTGNSSRQSEAAWRIFRRSRSASSLLLLLDVIGHDKRDDLLTDEIGAILGSARFSPLDAAFLVEIERQDAAETYVLKHADQLNGDYYGGLLPLSEAMEKSGRLLCASIIYRALLDSILRRAQSRIYHHGVNYLLKLDLLARCISEWSSAETHDVYLLELRRDHGRKSSFWSKYGK